MTQFLPDLSILNSVTVVGICVFGVIAFMRGWIVPGPIHRQAIADKDTQIGYLHKTIDVKDEQLGEMREVGLTVDAVLQSLSEQASRRQS